MKTKGFQLIELLITLSIIAILAALSLPIYTQYMTYARRLEAGETLSKLALAMEEYHIQNSTYQTASLTKLHFPEVIVKNHYQLAILSATDQTYLLAAKPTGRQFEKDKDCATLMLNSKGERQISGPGKSSECW